jgi:hypothetical protein
MNGKFPQFSLPIHGDVRYRLSTSRTDDACLGATLC